MQDLPIGFAMALAVNPSILNSFSSLSKDEQNSIIERTHKIKSKEEMHDFVKNLF